MAKMVSFMTKDTKEVFYGFMLDNGFCVCGCCGSVFESEDIEVIEEFEWIDIQDAIRGD